MNEPKIELYITTDFSEEKDVDSCRVIAWYIGDLDKTLPNYNEVKNILDSNLSRRLDKLDDSEKKKFQEEDAWRYMPELIRKKIATLPEKPNNTCKDKVLLFIHGLGGNSIETWGKFPQLIKDDSGIYSEYDIDFYSFPTGFFNLPFVGKKFCDIQSLADGLNTHIKNKLSKYHKIVFVCHSLGGLVAKKYLINSFMDGQSTDVSGVIYFATPHNGASLANVGKKILWKHRQLRQICKKSDFLEELNNAWTRMKLEEKIPLKYVYGGQDNVVGKESAKYKGEDKFLEACLDKDHRNLVKPVSEEDDSFKILRRFVLEEL